MEINLNWLTGEHGVGKSHYIQERVLAGRGHAIYPQSIQAPTEAERLGRILNRIATLAALDYSSRGANCRVDVFIDGMPLTVGQYNWIARFLPLNFAGARDAGAHFGLFTTALRKVLPQLLRHEVVVWSHILVCHCAPNIRADRLRMQKKAGTQDPDAPDLYPLLLEILGGPVSHRLLCLDHHIDSYAVDVKDV